MSAFNSDDYVDVSTRIGLFYKRFPDGRLTRDGDPYFVKIGQSPDGSGGKDYVVYKALAYRTPEDAHPAPGTAWEPWPGPTPFTRDSELMNAETAAIGRAIVMAGIPSQKIASQEEVQARGNGKPDRPQMPDSYEDALRMAIRYHNPNELKDEAEWEALKAGAAGSKAQTEAFVRGLEAALTDVGGDPVKVKARFEAVRS